MRPERSLLAAALVFALALTACAVAARKPARFVNPVLNVDFPDPAVLLAADGHYYAYATQGSHGGRLHNVQVARSADLVTWQQLADAMPTKPAWAAQTQDFWAPHVSLHQGRYVLYFSAKPDAAASDPTRGLCLGVATADAPGGPFIDSGRPLLCGAGFINIDPFAYDDPSTGQRLLYWGSGFGPIKVQPLAEDGLGFASGSAPIDLIQPVPDADPDNYQRLVEGAWVIRHDGYHYLFFSGDNCCGPQAHYAVMVARSRSATGPFEIRKTAAGRADNVMLRLGGPWQAPGHNSVIMDDEGTWWIIYHAVSKHRVGDGKDPPRVMMLDRLEWQNGWPHVAGNIPSSRPVQRPVISADHAAQRAVQR